MWCFDYNKIFTLYTKKFIKIIFFDLIFFQKFKFVDIWWFSSNITCWVFYHSHCDEKKLFSTLPFLTKNFTFLGVLTNYLLITTFLVLCVSYCKEKIISRLAIFWQKNFQNCKFCNFWLFWPITTFLVLLESKF